MTWRSEEDAFEQWCPHCIVEEVRIVELECCHLEGAPNIQIRQEALTISVNRVFDQIVGPDQGLIATNVDLGQGYSAISCVASLCSQWEISEEVIPEGQTPLGRCGIPT